MAGYWEVYNMACDSTPVPRFGAIYKNSILGWSLWPGMFNFAQPFNHFVWPKLFEKKTKFVQLKLHVNGSIFLVNCLRMNDAEIHVQE